MCEIFAHPLVTIRTCPNRPAPLFQNDYNLPILGGVNGASGIIEVEHGAQGIYCKFYNVGQSKDRGPSTFTLNFLPPILVLYIAS